MAKSNGNGKAKVKITINDSEYEVNQHRTLIDALHELEFETPNFCYHPEMLPAGNCRICYVNLADRRTGECSPQLLTSCTVPHEPDMKVWTDTDAVLKGREAVMEFLLLNHPLDCPVCDKSGECDLQDFTFLHARSKSRMVDTKNQYPVRDLGPTLKIWQTRCIVCTRCVRFLEEITGTGELTVVNRADRCEIDTFPGVPVDNPLMGNLTDVCPVGAIIDKDFLFQARVWYLQKCDTISPDSALGCNIVLENIEGHVKRIRPRRNDHVNGHWIADEERYNYRYISDPNRLTQPRLDGNGNANANGNGNGKAVPMREVVTAAAERLKRYGEKGELALITSAWATLEELDVFKQLAQALGNPPLAFLARPVVDDIEFKAWTLYGDKNPNRAGVELLLGKKCTEKEQEKHLAKIVKAITAGKIKALLVDTSIPTSGTIPYALPEALVEVLDRLELLVAIDILPGPLSEKAHVLLPGACYAEKSGTWINNQGRVQLLSRAIDPPGQAQESLALLQQILGEISGEAPDRAPSAADVFSDLAGRVDALSGMTHWKIRRRGQPLAAQGATK